MTAQQQIIAKYGQPGAAYQGKWCVLWNIQEDFPWFPAKRIYINRDFKDRLMLAFKHIEEAGLQEEIITFDGCYVERKVRGSSAISLHSWALACDFNAHTEKLGQTTTGFSDQFIALMQAAGVAWGGSFKGRKDPMHFAMFKG